MGRGAVVVPYCLVAYYGGVQACDLLSPKLQPRQAPMHLNSITGAGPKKINAPAYQSSVLKLLTGNPSVLNRSPTTKSLNA